MVTGSSGGDTFDGDYIPGGGSGAALDVSDLTNPASKNAADLVVYVTNAWQSGWGYVWGTYGQVLTPELFQYKLTQYPEGVGCSDDGQPSFSTRVCPCEPLCGLRGAKEGNHSGRGAEAVSAVFGLGYFWAGETPGVVNAPGRPLLPAVRAVLQGAHRCQTGKKIDAEGVTDRKNRVVTR